MNIYRVKLFTKNEQKEEKLQEYCLNNSLVAIGCGDNKVKDINAYMKKFNEKLLSGNSGEYQSVKNIHENMKEGDFVWAKEDGMSYWLGKIDSPTFLDDDKREIGPARKCIWKSINFDDVPGKITSCFVGIGPTLQTVKASEELKDYCNWLYNGKSEGKIVINDYKDLLHYDDLEDLLGLYLQKKLHYYILPSTNKTSTKFIEYELRKDSGEKACIQCKIGNSIVDEQKIVEKFNDYKIYIATIESSKKYNNGNVQKIEIETLWSWAKHNQKLLPERIKNYIKLCGK